jgi:hypothetical protein
MAVRPLEEEAVPSGTSIRLQPDPPSRLDSRDCRVDPVGVLARSEVVDVESD